MWNIYVYAWGEREILGERKEEGRCKDDQVGRTETRGTKIVGPVAGISKNREGEEYKTRGDR